MRPVRVLNACAATQDSLRDDAHGLILADNTLVQGIFQMQQLVALALHQACDRDAGPALDDLGNFLLRDLVAQQARAPCCSAPALLPPASSCFFASGRSPYFSFAAFSRS